MNVIVIKYEDLCNNHDSTLKLISDFMGVKYNERLLDFNKMSMQKRGHILKGNRLLQRKGIFKLQIDESWRTNLTRNELYKLKSEIQIKKYYKSFCYNL